jgi:hypothetical protein
MRLIRLALFALLLTSICSGSAGVHAQDAATPTAPTEPPKLSIRPIGYDGYFSIELKPGKSKKLTVELGNYGSAAVKSRTYAADVYTLINGGFGVRLDGEPTGGTTSWLNYTADTFLLDAQAAQQRTFSVKVPKGTPPGDYITALVLQPADVIKGSGGLAINQVIRQALAVSISVPGERKPSLSIGGASYSLAGEGANIQVAVANDGNQMLKPTGAFTLSDDTGKDLLSADLQLDSFYAGTQSAVEVGITTQLPPGAYHVALSLKANGVDVAASDVPFTVEPPATPVPAVEQGTITIPSVTTNELRGSDGALQAVEIVVAIDNAGPPIDNGRLSLTVKKDGVEVETIVLGSSLSFPGGPAEFRQRDLPLTGWTPGEWTFSVSLEQVDPTTGAVTTLATGEATKPISVT